MFLGLAFKRSVGYIIALLIHIDELIDSDAAENILTDEDDNILY